MLTADLHAISDLLDRALDLDASAREPWLLELARTEPKLATTLKTLLSRQGELETDQLLIEGGRAMDSAVLANAIEPLTGGRTRGPAAFEFSPQFILQSGTTIGPYRLIRPLGEGGMASVWLADRVDGQLKREVALKLLHAWRNSRELVERFARERDMLAGLAHPNIARLYDAGVTANGQPWIALEYVEGLDLAAYADQHALSIRQRVESILQVMAAVQYAHQNLIVHRDLKPSNILVNKKGEVRLLDFGIAKLLQQENVSAAETELTRNSGRALTLRYAAPEQIEGKPITTATDVYALGLVLYELLTGVSARQGKHSNKKSKKSSSTASEKTTTEAEREALTTDILRPSRGPIDKKIADTRGHATPAEIKSALSGDLDTILLKALAREPSRRYPTVSAFAADLGAWLERRPITARAPSLAYEARMFLSRQRVAVGVAGIVMLTLLGAGGYSWQQRTEAAAQRARSDEVQIFMANLLSEAEPEGVEGEKALTAKSLLDAGVARARTDYANKPLMRGEMLSELARVYQRLGESKTGDDLLKEAVALIEQNAAADEPSLHVAKARRGGQLLRSGEHESGVAMLNSVLQGCTHKTAACRDAKANAHLGFVHHPTATLDQKLAHVDSALGLMGHAAGADSAGRLQALLYSAQLQRMNGNLTASRARLNEAEPYFTERRAKSTERSIFGEAKTLLAFEEGAYSKAGAIADAMQSDLQGTLRVNDLIRLHVTRAHIANYQGLSAMALEHTSLARQMLAGQRPNYNFVYALRYEARALAMAGEYAKALQSVDEAFAALRQMKVSEQSQEWLDILRAKGENEARNNHQVLARQTLEKVLSDLRTNHPNNIKDQVSTLDLLGAVSLATGDAASALACHTEELKLIDTSLPATHPLRLRAALQVLRAKMQLEPVAGQQERFEELVSQLKKHLPDESIHTKVLSALVSNNSSESSKKQTLLIF